MKKITSLVMASTMVLTMFSGTASADSTLQFKDVKPTDWFYNQVTSLASQGIINGKGNGRFDPHVTVTEAEMVAMVHNAMAPVSERNPKPITDKWYSGYYNVWRTKFPTVLHTKDREYGTLVSDFSTYGTNDAHGGPMYEFSKIPLQMWIDYAEPRVKDDNGNYYDKTGHAQEMWEGAGVLEGNRKYNAYFPNHKQLPNYERPAISWDDLNGKVFGEFGAARPTTRLQAGYILDEYIEDYNNDMWWDAAKNNRINARYNTWGDYVNDFRFTIDPEYLSSTANMLYWGLFSGDTKGNLNAGANITRAEAATVIYRLVNPEVRKDNAARMLKKMNDFETRRQVIEDRIVDVIILNMRKFAATQEYIDFIGSPGVYSENFYHGTWDRNIVSTRIYELEYNVMHGTPQVLIIPCTSCIPGRHAVMPKYYKCELMSPAGLCMHDDNRHQSVLTEGCIPTGENESSSMIANGVAKYLGGELIAWYDQAVSPTDPAWDNQEFLEYQANVLWDAYMSSPGHKSGLIQSLGGPESNHSFGVNIGYRGKGGYGLTIVAV